jgi:hypothetical protein
MIGHRYGSRARRAAVWYCLPLLALVVRGVNAQAQLSISTPTAGAGNTVSFEISLNSTPRSAPASLQWTLQGTLPAIASLTVEDGPATTSAGKTVICAEKANGYTCLIAGANSKTIGNGVVAKVTASVSPDLTPPVIRIVDPFGSSAAGRFIPIFIEGGRVINTVSSTKSSQKK